MKKLSFIAAALFAVIAFAACTKNYYGSEFDAPPYRVDGISDFNISEDNPSHYMSLQVAYMTGAQENVKVTVEGVPQGLYANVYNGSGVPTFSPTITFYDSSATPGTYKATIVTTGSVSGRRSFPLDIKVDAVPDCRDMLVGSFSASSFCTSGTNPFSVAISKASGTKRILFNNFENAGVQVYGDISCQSQSISVPTQTYNGVTYYGSGSFYQNMNGTVNVYVYYYRTTGSGTSSCSLNMTK